MKPAPFSVITRRAIWGEPVRVYINDELAAEFATIAEADEFARALNSERIATEKALLESDAAEYWRLRCESAEALISDINESLAAHAGGVLSAFFDDLQAAIQRRNAGRQNKPPRRSPLRQAVIDAMRPARAARLTMHETLLSLMHSPPGALRIKKVGGNFLIENEDEDWSPELLTRAQLQELFKAAK